MVIMSGAAKEGAFIIVILWVFSVIIIAGVIGTSQYDMGYNDAVSGKLNRYDSVSDNNFDYTRKGEVKENGWKAWKYIGKGNETNVTSGTNQEAGRDYGYSIKRESTVPGFAWESDFFKQTIKAGY